MLQVYSAVVQTKEEIAKNIYRFVFELQNPPTIEFQAGQYIMLDCGGRGIRMYSISSPPHEKTTLETIVEMIPGGVGSTYLLGLAIGDIVSFRAPVGVFVLKKTENPKTFLAAGSGITPLKSMILDLFHQNFGEKVTLLWGMKTKQDMYLVEFFENLRLEHSNFSYTICLSREEAPCSTPFFKGHIQDALVTPQVTNNTEYYLCGRPSYIDAMKQFLAETLNVTNSYIYHEKYT